MELQTAVEIENYSFKLCHKDKIFMVGSCFADSVARKMEQAKMKVASNPLGVLYNPLSVERCFDILESGDTFNESDLLFDKGLWFSFDLHSSFSSSDKSELLKRANAAIERYSKEVEQSNIITITLGTAWVYRHSASSKIVCNCHKVLSREFERQLMEVEEVEAALERIIKKYPLKKFIFTLSPVRHTRDGLVDNSLSKSILRVAIDKITTRFENAVYFPSFEIMNDQLRDYRFYDRDMIHPSPLAVDYIWERFLQSFFDSTTTELINKIDKIRSAANHRPFNPETAEHREFCKKQLLEIEKLSEQGLDFSDEIKIFNK